MADGRAKYFTFAPTRLKLTVIEKHESGKLLSSLRYAMLVKIYEYKVAAAEYFDYFRPNSRFYWSFICTYRETRRIGSVKHRGFQLSDRGDTTLKPRLTNILDEL